MLHKPDQLHAASAQKAALYPSLTDKRLVITGGASGIGAALVEAFALQGARTAFVDIADEEAEALIESIAERGVEPPTFLHCDLTDLDQIETAFARIEREFGGVDVLVNNAANDDRHEIENITPEFWNDRIAVNLRHIFFCTQAVVPGMKQRRNGVILNFGSISWHLALPSIILYQTAKAGIEGMTRAMARDLGAYNIRVNTIVPGGVKTPRQDALWHDEEETRRILDSQCLKERVTPTDVAALTLFLASDDARMCTGHDYFVDAGWR